MCREKRRTDFSDEVERAEPKKQSITSADAVTMPFIITA